MSHLNGENITRLDILKDAKFTQGEKKVQRQVIIREYSKIVTYALEILNQKSFWGQEQLVLLQLCLQEKQRLGHHKNSNKQPRLLFLPKHLLDACLIFQKLRNIIILAWRFMEQTNYFRVKLFKNATKNFWIIPNSFQITNQRFQITPALLNQRSLVRWECLLDTST